MSNGVFTIPGYDTFVRRDNLNCYIETEIKGPVINNRLNNIFL